jgi:hypothetical protein
MFITVLGWDKINPRKDVDNPSWFKFKHKFFEDPEFYDFSPEERLVWLYFLCMASFKNDHGIFYLSIHHANHTAKLSEEVLYSAIKKLQTLKLISKRASRPRDVDGTYTCARLDKIREEKKREEEIRVDKREILKTLAIAGFENRDQEYCTCSNRGECVACKEFGT